MANTSGVAQMIKLSCPNIFILLIEVVFIFLDLTLRRIKAARHQKRVKDCAPLQGRLTQRPQRPTADKMKTRKTKTGLSHTGVRPVQDSYHNKKSTHTISRGEDKEPPPRQKKTIAYKKLFPDLNKQHCRQKIFLKRLLH